MSWRDRMYPASWRGVPFSVKSHDLGGGHRLAEHTLAGFDGQVTQPIGRAPEGFSVNAFVWGEDYDKARDRLLAELRKGGFGELVHPWFGTLRVKCKSWTLSEQGENGGQATFSINFVESSESLYPTSANDSKSLAETAADSANSSASESFVEGFSVAGFPAFVAESAAAQVEMAADAISGVTGFIGAQSSDIAELAVTVARLKDSALDLVSTPSVLATELISAIDLLNKSADTKNISFSLFDFGSDLLDFDEETPAKRLQQKNQKAFNALVRSVAIASAVREVVSVNFETQDDALLYRNTIMDAIDNLAEYGVDDPVYDNLLALRLSFSKALEDSSINLPKVKQHFVKYTIPSLVLSHRLYGTAAKADDIVRRNKLEHPGFIFGETYVQVLVNA